MSLQDLGLGAVVVAAVIVGSAVLLAGCTARITSAQREAVEQAEAQVSAVAVELGGEVADVSRVDLGVGAAIGSTDPHIEVSMDLRAEDPTALYEGMAAALGLRPAANGATSIGMLGGGVRIQVVPAEDHVSAYLTGTQ